MKVAPEVPSRYELHAEYGIDVNGQIEVLRYCAEIAEAVDSHDESTVALIGACAMTNDQDAILLESARIAELGASTDGLKTLHRIPVWKPRSEEDSWFGLETNIDPNSTDIDDGQGARAAYSTLSMLAKQNPIESIEIATKEHIDRYGPMLSFGWVGSRGIVNQAHILNLAVRDPKMTLGIKNGIDGNIEQPLALVDEVESVRESGFESAPAILIYRGGDNATNPKEWEDIYLDALERTNGKLIVDVAHGSEMAHHPDGTNKKSVEGQIAALEHVITLASDQHIPAGIMIEASDIDSPTDPVMPLHIALDGVRRLHAIKQRNLVAA